MKRFFLAVIAAVYVSVAMADPVPVATLQAQVDENVHSLQASDLWIGGAVAVTNGVISHVSIYGKRDTNDNQSPDGNSHFEIASLSKTFTGIILAWVANQQSNPVQFLDEPIGNFAPEITGNFASKITLRKLATQVSGLPATFCMNDGAATAQCYFTAADSNNPWVDLNESELLAFLNAYSRTDSAPYTYAYSNPGFITLGYVLSKITGKNYEQLVEEVITSPLKMSDTLVNQPGAQVRDFLQGHNIIQLPQEHWQWEISAPTGGIVSTPNDMGKYVRACLNPPKTALGRAITLSEKNGLGWDSAPGASIIWKNGLSAGFSAYIMIDPNHKQALVALSNLGSNLSGDYFPYYALFGNAKPEISGLTLSDQTLDAFVGAYTNPQQPGKMVVTRLGHYLMFNGGDPTSDFRLQATSPLDFDTADWENYVGYNKLTFQQDSQGKTVALILRLNDGTGHFIDFRFNKVSQ